MESFAASPHTREQVDLLAILRAGVDLEAIKQLAGERGWQLDWRENWRDGVDFLKSRQNGIVLFDSELFDGNWREALPILLDHSPASCMIPLLPHANERCFQQVVRRGGYDVIKTPLDKRTVVRTVRFAWAYWQNCLKNYVTAVS